MKSCGKINKHKSKGFQTIDSQKGFKPSIESNKYKYIKLININKNEKFESLDKATGEVQHAALIWKAPVAS